MRRTVLAALALAACTREAPAEPVLRNLLTQEDVPEGYVLTRDDPPKRVGLHPPASPPACAQHTGEPTAYVPQSGRIYARGPRLIVQSVTLYESEEAAHAALARPAACPSVTARAPGQPDLVTPASVPLKVPPIGDEAVGARDRPGGTTLMLTFRSGRVVVGIVLVDAGSERLLRQLAQRALERLGTT